MSLQHPIAKADALIEALPYLQAFRGKTFLIKMGGSAMEDPGLVAQVMRDIVFLEVAGINPIVVHGGGKAISAAMKSAGLEANFIGGFRVTTDDHRGEREEILHRRQDWPHRRHDLQEGPSLQHLPRLQAR
jgi:acetylglutamate kinase